MATRYVNSGASGSNNGTSWTDAYTTFGAAVTAAADADIILVHKTHSETLTANTTYTFNSVSVYCVDKDASDALAIMESTVGLRLEGTNTTLTFAVTASKYAYCYGLYITGVSSTSARSIAINTNATNDATLVLEACSVVSASTSAGASFTISNANSVGKYLLFLNCTLTHQRFFTVNRYVDFVSCVLTSSTNVAIFGGPWFGSVIGSEIVGASASALCDVAISQATFARCKLQAGLALIGATASNGKVFAYDCASGDQHYHLAYADQVGALVMDTGIYADDGASYDGTNRLSWKIVTTASCTWNRPFRSPWIDVYHDGSSAITPSLEIVRSGSATAYTDAQVWVEFSAKTTSGSARGALVSDRSSGPSTGSNQTTGALDGSGWTGEDATSWFGKLAPNASFTPAEIGHIRARICVGAELTVYADPQIRGLS